jgi:hypothetical protein
MEMRGAVLLDDERQSFCATLAYAARGLGRRLEVALFSVELERHRVAGIIVAPPLGQATRF